MSLEPEPEDQGAASCRLVLTGFMGSGKSVVGASLARRLGWTLVDLDTVIERRAGCTIPQIFEHDGEATFRDLEHQALAEVLVEEQRVIATGGGTFVAERNRQLLTGQAVSIWLDPGFDTILRRLSPEERARRPLFRDPEEARRLYQRRKPIYRTADHRVDVGQSETPDDVAARIDSLIRDSEPHKH